jgi:hypothetical protein
MRTAGDPQTGPGMMVLMKNDALDTKKNAARPPRLFHMHETRRQHELEGLPLATFGQRFLGYAVDLFLALVLWIPLEFCWRRYVLHETHIDLKWDFHEAGNIVVMVLYWATCNYLGNGRTVGKYVAGTQAMSLTGERLGLWQSIERALGYGAAFLEAGLGFAQMFWDKNRMCAQDRLAETVVIDVRKRSRRQQPSAVETQESTSLTT